MTLWSTLRHAVTRAYAFVNRRALDREFTQELESHIALSADDHMRRGLTPEAARRAALIEFGPPASLADQHRAVRGLPAIDDMVRDVRYGFRLLRRRPGGSTLAILTIALAVGATTSIFSVAYGVLLRPLPFPDEHQLVRLNEWREGGDPVGRPFMTRPTFEAWSAQSSTLQGLAAWSAIMDTVVPPGAAPERAQIVEANASVFDVLRVRPAVGTNFTPQQEASGDRVALISHGFWQRAFSGHSDVIGQTLVVGGEPVTIVGVMPPAFGFPDRDTVVWKPLGRDMFVLNAVGRLAVGATVQQASEEGTARSRVAPDMGRRGLAIFGSTGLSHVSAVHLRSAMTASVQPVILLVLGGGALLLAIAAVNVAGVQLARTAARRRELAIRTAIGADWSRIARQVVVENLVISGLGGAAGLLIAMLVNTWLPRLASTGVVRLDDVKIDGSVLLFAAGLTLSVGVLCGLIPALLIGRRNVVNGLLEGGHTPAGPKLRTTPARARWLLMAGQVMMAAALLAGASLVTRSFIAVIRADRGFEPAGLLTARLPFSGQSFTRAQRTVSLDEIVTRLQHTPGVVHAAATDILPLIDLEFPRAFELPAAGPGGDIIGVKAMSRSVTRDYFSTLGMRLDEGRLFDETDTMTSRPVAVVNGTFARRYLDGRTAIGTDLPVRFSRDKTNWQIVGIVGDVRNQHAGDPPQPEVFGCVCQMEEGMLADVPAIAVRTSADAEAFAPTLRHVVREVAPTASLESVMTMDERLRTSVAGQRMSMVLFGAFAAFAILVVGVGLFGVLSFTVSQRTRELGVRKALGAGTGHIMSIVIRQAVIIVAPGLALGLPVALVVSRYYRPLLFGVSAADPVALVAVPAVLALITLAATLVPALRAARLDPMRVVKDV